MKELFGVLRGVVFILKCKLLGKNVHVGKGLKIYKKLIIEGKGRVYIGENCTVNGIKGDASKYVTIDTHSPEALIRIGDNVGLFAVRISSSYQIDIGNRVLIEESGIVDTDFHSIDKARGAPLLETRELCAIAIGNNVCIGASSVVTKGVTIGDNAVITPGSVVSRSVQSGSFVSGNPARSVVIKDE